MNAQLLFIHGRAQEHKNALALKNAWISALREGLSKSRLDLPIPEADIRFPYFGDTLFDLVEGSTQVAQVVVRGARRADPEQEFQRAVLEEVRKQLRIPDEEIESVLDPKIKERGPLQWGWVHGILKAIDQHLPGGSALSIALATRDVYQYLQNPGVRDLLERGVRAAFTPGMPTVVVAHSLGTVVAYNLIRREGDALGWKVPLLVTVGSPLAVTAIKAALAPIEFPSCVRRWYNARDVRDVVALYPLEEPSFDIDPKIENNQRVRNKTDNRHGIAGYLDDAEVARRVYDALMQA